VLDQVRHFEPIPIYRYFDVTIYASASLKDQRSLPVMCHWQ